MYRSFRNRLERPHRQIAGYLIARSTGEALTNAVQLKRSPKYFRFLELDCGAIWPLMSSSLPRFKTKRVSDLSLFADISNPDNNIGRGDR